MDHKFLVSFGYLVTLRFQLYIYLINEETISPRRNECFLITQEKATTPQYSYGNKKLMDSCRATSPTSRTRRSCNCPRKRTSDEIMTPSSSRYTSSNMILLKWAMKNSMLKKGGIETVIAENMVIIPKPSSGSLSRRSSFQIKPSRLSIVSNAQDLTCPLQQQ